MVYKFIDIFFGINKISIMESEKHVRVVTDSGSSMRPEYKNVQELGVVILPLDVVFHDGNNMTTISDFDLEIEDFYKGMANSKKLPTTSGAVTGKALMAYRDLSSQTKEIVSIHLTSSHSGVYNSAVIASQQIKEGLPELSIEVIDSKNLSLGAWYIVEAAAMLAQEGAPIETVKQEALEVIPKIETYIGLYTLDNVIAGGRVPTLMGHVASVLQINPVLEVRNGKLEIIMKPRTFGKAKKAIVERVALSDAEILKMSIVHANAPDTANEIKEALSEFYHGEIGVYEAGTVLGVHAGIGTVGVSFQKA